MKKYFLSFLLAVTVLPQTQAQSTMSDQEIAAFVQREAQKGTPESTIVTRLVERGVSVDRIRNLQKKYAKDSGRTLGTRDISLSTAPESSRRLRKGTAAGHQQQPVSEEKDYAGELAFLLPDSLLDYEAEVIKLKTTDVFGRNIFNQKNLTFEPNLNISMPADYRLGPGDAVFVDIWGASQKTFTSTVSPDGMLNIEGFGPVNVNGLTIVQAQNRLNATLGSRYAGSRLRLTVGETKSISVNVMGEVVTPGTYTLSPFATVFQALYSAGGVGDIGTLRDIKVYRDGRLVTSVDVYDYILNGNLRGNVRLASGDVIVVGPYDCIVTISGKVKRPMRYEMKKNESVATLIKYAGGFMGNAYEDNLRLVRKAGESYSVYTIGEFDRGTFQLLDGDSLSVDSTLARYSNMVELKGAVRRPGMYQMDGDIATVRALIEAGGGLLEEAVTARGIIHRRKADRTLEVQAFDIAGLMTHRDPDITLRNEDIVFIPSREDQLREQKLSITGEVTYPGTYNYAEGTTLEDLVLQAGGLTNAASTVRVDVNRRIRHSDAQSSSSEIAHTYTFSLKDGFVVDGEPGFTLEPFDEVIVRRSPGYTEQENVTVSGEIAFAGTYAMTSKNMRLSDLILRAGGLKDEAYSAGAHLERLLSEDDEAQIASMLKMATSGDSINLSKLTFSGHKNVGINLDMALSNPGDDRWDIVLKEGDHLFIPQYDNTVSINGEVMMPNTVAYIEGKKLDYYINSAGGYSLKAKTRRAFAVHMNGTVTRVKKASDIRPGSTIIVPSKPERERASLAQILSIGTTSVAMIAALLSAFK
ncbi:MAG: SLBB domain-containing protein [Prevotellaceae bacterium]|nr:SLBB domain-containing protein [Prevotellaceae bacterium]